MKTILKILTISTLAHWQISTLTLAQYLYLRSIPVKATATHAPVFTTDNLRNVYLITGDNDVSKFNPDGEKIFTYSEKKYGKLAFIDASNPLKVLLFFPEFSVIVAVDNTLSVTGTYDLKSINIPWVSAIGLAIDNNIWIYDEQDFRLKKIDETLNLIHQSEDLSNYLNISLNPNFLMERNNWLYLNDPSHGIFVFDIYGSYYKTIPLKKLKNFQILGDQLIYKQDEQYKSYHLKTLEEKIIQLPDSTATRQVRIEKDRLYLLKEKQLELYLIKTNE